MKTILDGYKTYLIGALGILTVLAWNFSYLTPEASQAILGILGFGGLMTLRAAVKK